MYQCIVKRLLNFGKEKENSTILVLYQEQNVPYNGEKERK